MSDTDDILIRATARALAAGQRVLVVGEQLELLEILADEAVKELVLVTALADPDAPAGETGGGAPLRMRPDWRERPSSKDLVVDPHGVAPAAEVTRVLKKRGVYLSGVESAAWAALPSHRVVRAQQAQTLLLGEGAAQLQVRAADDADGPTLYVAGKTAPALPAVACPLPGVALASSAELADAQASLAEAQARLEDQGLALEAAEALGQRTLELEDALANAEEAAEAAAGEAAANAKALTAAQAALAELEAEYNAVRDELAGRRIQDRRFDAVKARFDGARAEMGAELEALRAQLREMGELGADTRAVLAERDAARAAFDMVVERVGAAVTTLEPGLPAPPAAFAGPAVHDAWIGAVDTTVTAAAGAANRLRADNDALRTEFERVARDLRERTEAMAAVRAEASLVVPPAGPDQHGPEVAALTEQLQALEAALDAERRARAAESRAYREQISAAESVLGDRQRVMTALSQARADGARARLGAAASEERRRRIEAERDLRARRIADLEAMVEAHTQMQSLLAEALAEAEQGRDQAEAGRRLVEANLKILQVEFERGQR